MIKQLTSFLGYSAFAELALIMFAAVFVAIVLRTLLTRSDVTEAQSQIVLDADAGGRGSVQTAHPDITLERYDEQ